MLIKEKRLNYHKKINIFENRKVPKQIKIKDESEYKSRDVEPDPVGSVFI